MVKPGWDPKEGQKRIAETFKRQQDTAKRHEDTARRIKARRGDDRRPLRGIMEILKDPPPECVEVRVPELPGGHGYECSVRQFVALKTVHLRRELYITMVGWDGEEFKPVRWEHYPVWQAGNYQTAHGEPYAAGEGRPVTFKLYSPRGSGTALEGAEALRGALQELSETVAPLPSHERRDIALECVKAWQRAAVGIAPYRPDLTAPPVQGDPYGGAKVLLRSWGGEDLASVWRRHAGARIERT